MNRKYDPHKIEQKWQAQWPKERASYKLAPGDEPYYVLDMISYPSSEGLHMGHWRPYTIADVWARYQTLQGKKVLSPVGFDAFGLPAENAAIKNRTHPAEYTKKSIANFTRQIEAMGKMYDWSTRINTSDPDYYNWTQWLFVQLYNHGLAYRKSALVNFCPNCQTVLANEQVINGRCERCDTEVIKKQLRQWFLKITDFAEQLLDFNDVNYPDQVKTLQTNWIGKSEGAEIDFEIVNPSLTIKVFTTRPDTLMGATYLVVAPEYPPVESLLTDDYKAKAEQYIQAAIQKSEIDRTAENREKTGVFTGSYARHPLTGKDIPIWIADYVIGTYGTGAIMAVPAHDQRDYEFAKQYELPIVEVITPETGVPQVNPQFRQSVVALVRNPSTNEILTINWGDKGGILFIGGGREEAEDAVTCAIREIAEETGYSHVKYVAQTGRIYHNYFAQSKNQPRRIEAIGLLFDLIDTEQINQSHQPDEENQFSVEWRDANAVAAEVKDELHALVYRQLINHEVYSGNGILVNSGEFDGLMSTEAKEVIINKLKANGKGRAQTTYRLRDWLVSRQRYWGAPIPIIYCETCGEQAVPEADLPVLLPEDAEFIPTGGSPLERHPTFKDTTCPKCGGEALRETDTLDVFVDSSWYYLRFTSPNDNSKAFDYEQIKAWLPVDFYVGGTEHSILHLLYARFVMKALHKMELVAYDEPFKHFYGNGMVYLYGKKMSKSKGNVVNPDDMVKQYGTDALRGYILFMGPADQDVEWQDNGITGVSRFLHRVWQLFQMTSTSDDQTIHPAIQKAYRSLNQLLPEFHFNRCISSLMIAINDLGDHRLNQTEVSILLHLLAPFFPHISEELWSQNGNAASLFASSWPKLDVTLDEIHTYVIQVNGRTRATIELSPLAGEEEVRQKAEALPSVAAHLAGKIVQKVIFVPGRIINFVVQ